MSIIKYEDFGAIGDGITNDFDAIINAHNEANKTGATVSANPNATYYIGGDSKTAIIKTNTNWGNAKFIIDDTNVLDRRIPVFHVMSSHSIVDITNIKTLVKNQNKLDLELEHDALILAIDNTTMRFIREGLNPDNGTQQTDIFIVDKHGNVDPKTEIIWDFTNISSLTAYPIDKEILTLASGVFTTLANKEEAVYNYFSRHIKIERSNVVIDGLVHYISGEDEKIGAPYSGFVSATHCANLCIQNSTFTGHRTYWTTGRANLPVQMGTYDILIDESVNILIKNCTQTNDISDDDYWGVFSSNFTKNIIFDRVNFSRFDAHKGTTNTIIRNSSIGHMGVKLIGSGNCIIENTKIYGHQLVELRADYGSTWEGEIAIINCEFTPHKMDQNPGVIIGAEYNGLHDFGYKCYMPSKILIDGLIVNDKNHGPSYNGPRIFSNIHENYMNEDFEAKYPYELTKELEISRFSTTSGKEWKISDNENLFKNVKVK